MGEKVKTLDFLGAATFERASNSQCGGEGFDPPLLHHFSPSMPAILQAV